MGAYKAGVKTVIIPMKNFADISEVDEIVKENVEFIPAHTIEEVLNIAVAADKVDSKPVRKKASSSARAVKSTAVRAKS